MNKITRVVRKFLLEDVIRWYGYIEKIVVDRGELNAHEAIELFQRLGVKDRMQTHTYSQANCKELQWATRELATVL